MADWEDVLREGLLYSASALRKAKAAGLREAADNVSDYVDAATQRLRFLRRAAQIERGEDG